MLRIIFLCASLGSVYEAVMSSLHLQPLVVYKAEMLFLYFQALVDVVLTALRVLQAVMELQAVLAL